MVVRKPSVFLSDQSWIASERTASDALNGVLDKAKDEWAKMWNEKISVPTDLLRTNFYKNQYIGDLCEYVFNLERCEIRRRMLEKLKTFLHHMTILNNEMERVQDVEELVRKWDLTCNVSNKSALFYVLDEVMFLVSDCRFNFDDLTPSLNSILEQLDSKKHEEPKQLTKEDYIARAMLLQLGMSNICQVRLNCWLF
uniref:Cullin domain-containing protein n=2 Tax=Steinernema glaseri TaxID=37863 RepID=A0A1I8AP04_9BILA